MAAASMRPLTFATIPRPLRAKAIGWFWPQFGDSEIQCLIETYEYLGREFGESYWNGLIGSFRGEELTGAAWTELQAGRVAAIHGPKLADDEQASTAQQLVQITIEHAIGCQIRLIQALKPLVESAETSVLLLSGFRHVADLLYMVADGLAGPPQPPPTSLHFESYSAATHGRLMAVVERTYVGSLDCPVVDGLRTVDDVLAGYRATGLYNPDRWLIASASLTPNSSPVDVGCVLLTEQPLTDQWELMYMGVIPEGRGRGWGLEMVQRAQWMARTAGAKRMVLAVDAANEPGLRMYAATGFHTFGQRALFLREIAAAVD